MSGPFPPPPAVPTPPWAPPLPHKPRPQWPIATLLAITLVVAIGVALAGWFRPLPDNRPPATPAFTNQQIADAKAKACSAFEKVRASVSLQTHANSGTDPAMTQAVAANARLALVTGAYFLEHRIDPATPQTLSAALHSFSDLLLDLAESALGGATDNQELEHQGEADTAQIADMCK
jgi:hypothetical protein